MTGHQPPVLLFDLGGVLIENDMFDALQRLTGGAVAPERLLERWLVNPVARRFELGQCDPETFSRAIVADLGVDLAPADFLEQFAGWPRGFAPGALSMLAALRGRHRIGALSNSNAVHWRGGFTEPFDFAYSSHLIGHIKPDAAAFRHVIEQQGLEDRRVLYFDDADSNVRAARACGLDAHRTVGFDALRATLASLGIGI